MNGLEDFSDFLPQRLPIKQSGKLSKRQRKKLMRLHGERQQEQGLGLFELVKSKEFKERVALLKEGGRLSVKVGKIAYVRGRIAAVKLAARIKKARSKRII